MKANELRIGNLVNYLIEDNFEDPSKWYQETYIDAEDLLILSKKGCDNYQPIPITEERLLKFGFEHWDIKAWAIKGKISIYKQDGVFWYIAHSGNEVCLEHVHQLQNLYFALIGEELKYELE
jgi:hypothetical protein